MANTRVVGQPKGTIEDKLYISGVTLEDTCPACGAPWSMYLGDYKLYQPQANAPTDVGGYCDTCDHRWPIQILIKMSVEIFPT